MDEPEHPATVSLNRHAQLGAPAAITTAWSAYVLFLNYFDLFIDHLPGEAIDCNVHPVVLLAFHNEIILEGCCVWFIVI
jgi:hypothetical protein